MHICSNRRKAIQNLLITETLARTDHVDDEGKDDGKGQLSLSGEISRSDGSLGIRLVLWQKFLKKLHGKQVEILAFFRRRWHEIFRTPSSLSSCNQIQYIEY